MMMIVITIITTITTTLSTTSPPHSPPPHLPVRHDSQVPLLPRLRRRQENAPALRGIEDVQCGREGRDAFHAARAEVDDHTTAQKGEP